MSVSVPKICGADIELGNLIFDREQTAPNDTTSEAARLLLSEIRGRPRPAVTSQYQFREENGVTTAISSGSGGMSGYCESVQDQGRKFLPGTGGCAYIDLQHFEMCIPEVGSAFDHCAAIHGMLRVVRDAMGRANDRLGPSRSLKVLVNNSDGHGNSYGSHLNFLVTRECYDNIFHRRPHYLHFLASFQVASIILTGAGKVGAEDGGVDPVRYQISARADFFETLAAVQTTFRRPICNTRDESLTGPPIAAHPDDPQLARVHVIFYDNTLAHTASVLKVGMMQIVLAMLEQGRIPGSRWLLEDPVQSVRTWSRDPDLRATAPLVDRTQVTAAELLQAIFEEAKRFVDSGRADGIVPDAARIIEIWGDCLDRVRQRDFAYLARRIDWIAKLALLERAAGKLPEGWNSPRIKLLDHVYSSLDAREGLYWALERNGGIEKLIPDERIERFAHEPPDDTRAWLRSYVLRHAPPGLIDDVDWDMLRLRVEGDRFGAGGWIFYRYPTLHLCSPYRFTRAECEPILRAAPTLLQGLEALGLGAHRSSFPNAKETDYGNATSPTAASASHARRPG